MLATSNNVLSPGRNHLLATGSDDWTPAGAQVIIKVLSVVSRWLWPGNSTSTTMKGLVITAEASGREGGGGGGGGRG